MAATMEAVMFIMFNIYSFNIDISIPFEDLESVENSPPMGGCFLWWVDGWVSGSKDVKS